MILSETMTFCDGQSEQYKNKEVLFTCRFHKTVFVSRSMDVCVSFKNKQIKLQSPHSTGLVSVLI